MYKIIFNMTSPICYYDRPVFDAILSYCAYSSQRRIADMHTPHGSEVISPNIPIKLHEMGFYLASYMFYNENVEGQDAWKKRWASKCDHIADFGKARRRIDIGSGRFKLYNIPVVTHSIKTAWFFFDGDPDGVADLISRYLPGFGKKVAMGYGWFSSFSIKEVTITDDIYIRPLPMAFGMSRVPDGKARLSFGAYKPPYWLPENQTNIIIPEMFNKGEENA